MKRTPTPKTSPIAPSAPHPGLSAPAKKALARLADLFEAMPGGVAVAFSGGMDSGFLALAANRFRPEAMGAWLVTSEVIPAGEAAHARELALRFGIPLKTLALEVLQLDAFARHPSDRCYHCKQAVFTRLRKAIPKGWVLCDGTNLDDRNDYRPGRKALTELAIRSPLEEAGFSKALIREVLTDWQAGAFIQPAQPCLATRIPFDTPVTPERLAAVEKGEILLREAGFLGARLRHHGEIARLEIVADELEDSLERLQLLVPRFKALGFKHVTLDLEGYRTGSLLPPGVVTPRRAAPLPAGPKPAAPKPAAPKPAAPKRGAMQTAAPRPASRQKPAPTKGATKKSPRRRTSTRARK